MKQNKTNKKFMLLSAIGIFMVVDHHTFTALNLFGDYIPYNSFFMPMFVFISGYFNKVDSETKMGPYTLKKIKSLLVPYLGISFAVFIFQQLINLFKMGQLEPVSPGYLLYMLERVVTCGSPFALVTPMWFVITLFATLMIYALLKKSLYKFWNSYVMFGLFTALQLLAVYLAKSQPEEVLHWFLLPLKVMFFLPFLEMGKIYKDNLEEKHCGLSGGGKVGLMAALLFINMLRTTYLPAAYDVAFDSLDELAGFTSPFIVTPMISSLVGIFFWLTFVDLIGNVLYESRFINFMSNNTFWIMGFHIMFYNVLNCIFLLIDNIFGLPYFDAQAFRDSEWYMWEISPNIKLAYVLIGILGPLSFKWIFSSIVNKLPMNKNAKKCN